MSDTPQIPGTVIPATPGTVAHAFTEAELAREGADHVLAHPKPVIGWGVDSYGWAQPILLAPLDSDRVIVIGLPDGSFHWGHASAPSLTELTTRLDEWRQELMAADPSLREGWRPTLVE